MEGYQQILVGTDGSADAMAAVEAAIRFASAFSVPLVVISAWQDEGNRRAVDEGGGAAEQAYLRAKQLTEEAEALAQQRGLDTVERLEPAGNAAEELLVAAEERPGSLLVVGSRGLDRAIDRFVGNVPHQLSHHSPVDLLLVNENGGGWQTIAAATDGSTTATRAVHRGVAVARALGVVPRIVTVAKDEEEAGWALSAVTTQLAETEFDTEVIEGSSGSPAKHLIEASARYDLLVIGNRGMSGPSRLLGSVSNRVTHEMPTDLLLVNTRE